MKEKKDFDYLRQKKEELAKKMCPNVKKVDGNDPQLDIMLKTFDKDDCKGYKKYL